ncbi:MAG: hypothetical protein S4CHLAM20_07400 [Chlamydiia bacterium]|nr:hypothetical protein [Chlamydiia bacterium]
MFGLNKKDKKPNPFFRFPLEQDLENTEKLKEMMDHAEKKILAIKKTIKEGASPDDYEKLGTMLHGYGALLKIFSRVPGKK